jgi:hypothetical protein
MHKEFLIGPLYLYYCFLFFIYFITLFFFHFSDIYNTFDLVNSLIMHISKVFAIWDNQIMGKVDQSLKGFALYSTLSYTLNKSF